MFDLKRPCKNCPFRKGQGEVFRLHPDRLTKIIDAPAFQCHKTVDYSGDTPSSGDKPQQCAGLMALLHQEERPNQIMQIAMRLGVLDPSKLHLKDAYASFSEMRCAHGADC